MKPELTAEYARECLDYNPDTGIFTWKERPLSHFKTRSLWLRFKTRFAGRKAGTPHNEGYVTICISKYLMLAHRLALIITNGSFPDADVDHINGIRSDNRLCNLRCATRSENSFNSRMRRDNTSGVKNVYFNKETSRWYVKMNISNGVTLQVGTFASKDEAASVANNTRSVHHGEFANHG